MPARAEGDFRLWRQRVREWFLNAEFRSWFLGSGFGQQLFNFRSPAFHWIARTSSLNCLSCRNPYQTPHSLNPSPLFTENPFFSLKSVSSDPLPKNRLLEFEHTKKRGVNKQALPGHQPGNLCVPPRVLGRFPKDFLQFGWGLLSWWLF